MRARAKITVGGGVLVGAYAAIVRPWFLSWGTHPSEVDRELPGDHLVERPRVLSTRAITIEAAVEQVWPWLAQMGQDRGGLYSYDWLENLAGCRIHNADWIVPEWQQLDQGDQVRLAPPDLGGGIALEVDTIDPPFALVLRSPGDRAAALAEGMPWASWAFVLVPLTPHRCRLAVRWRADYTPTVTGVLVNQLLVEPVHFLMERKMLLGIKERAERPAVPPAWLVPPHAA